MAVEAGAEPVKKTTGPAAAAVVAHRSAGRFAGRRTGGFAHRSTGRRTGGLARRSTRRSTGGFARVQTRLHASRSARITPRWPQVQGELVPAAAIAGGAARGFARIAIARKQATQPFAKPMGASAATIGTTTGTTTGSDNGRRSGRRRGLLVPTLANQHGRCHQQERSIHEDSSNKGLRSGPGSASLDSRVRPSTIASVACALFVLKLALRPPSTPVCPDRRCRVFSCRYGSATA